MFCNVNVMKASNLSMVMGSFMEVIGSLVCATGCVLIGTTSSGFVSSGAGRALHL